MSCVKLIIHKTNKIKHDHGRLNKELLKIFNPLSMSIYGCMKLTYNLFTDVKLKPKQSTKIIN